MRTLERLALDKAHGFSGGEESLLDRMSDVGKQLLIFMTGAHWVTAKGMTLGVQDVILHWDDDGGSFLLMCHDCYGPFSVLIEHMFRLTAGLMTYTICGEDRADASTGTTVLNDWVSESTKLTQPPQKRTTYMCYKYCSTFPLYKTTLQNYLALKASAL
jgi:hypothetical protein